MSELLELIATWKGTKYPVYVLPDATLAHVKDQLAHATGVLPHRQKLLGVVNGKLPPDNVSLRELAIPSGKGFMMMGTAEEEILTEPDDMPEILNDLDDDFYSDEWERAVSQENQLRLQKHLAKIPSLPIRSTPHPGKKLLVLDLDRTLFDHKSVAATLDPVMRPGLHEFLVAMSDKYNLAIWSQSTERRLQSKLSQLGILDHVEYSICLVLDRTTMFSVQSVREGKPYWHAVKALQVIWTHLPGTGPHNTVHVDDLSRNFALNPRNGIKIRGYSMDNRDQDCELLWLAQYLLDIADCEDVSAIAHDKWKKFSKKIVERKLKEGE